MVEHMAGGGIYPWIYMANHTPSWVVAEGHIWLPTGRWLWDALWLVAGKANLGWLAKGV
jgi:hypothetical protein